MKGSFKHFLTGIGAVVLFLLCQTAASFAVLLAAVFANGLDAVLQSLEAYTVQITLVSALLTLAILAIIAAAKKRPLMAAAGLVPMKAVLWPVCLALGFGLNLAVSVLLNFIPFPESWLESYSSSSSLLNTDNMLLYIAAVVVIVPLTEEVVFRRAAYDSFKHCTTPWAAALMSAVIFGLCHGTLLWMLYTVPLALLLCRIYERCRSLWGSVLLHIGFNSGSILFEYLPNDTADITLWFIMAAGTAIGIICLVFIHKYTAPVRASYDSARCDNTPMEN